MTPLLTYAEACELLRCGRNKLRLLISQGELDMRDMGHRTKRITRRSVEKYINEGRPLRGYKLRAAS